MLNQVKPPLKEYSAISEISKRSVQVFCIYFSEPDPGSVHSTLFRLPFQYGLPVFLPADQIPENF